MSPLRLLAAALALLALGGCQALVIPAVAGFLGTVGGNIASDKIEGK